MNANCRRQTIVSNGKIKTLIFSKKGLDKADLETWSAVAVKCLTLGPTRKVENNAMVVTAIMVRLFPLFRFQSVELLGDVKSNLAKNARSNQMNSSRNGYHVLSLAICFMLIAGHSVPASAEMVETVSCGDVTIAPGTTIELRPLEYRL